VTTASELDAAPPPTSVETRPETRPETVPSTRPAPKPETKQEPKVEPKVEPKIEPKVEPKVEPKTEPKPDLNLVAKLPLPDAPKLLEAQKQIQEKYAADYNRKTVADRQVLAGKLYKEALSAPRDNPAYRYVLFHEATNRAVDAGDLGLALRLIDELDRRYIIDALAARLQVLSGAVQSQQPPAVMKSFVETALDLADDYVDQDNFAAAKALLDLAEIGARKASNPPLLSRVQGRIKEVAEIASDYPDARRSADVLFLKSPKDLQASWRWGRFLGCLKGDWDQGLPWIAQGGDARFGSLARKDLARPKEPQAQMEVADAWWELAEDAQGVARKELYLRAKFWYELALEKLGTLTKGRVERRLKELPRLLAGEPPTPEKPPTELIPKETYERQLAMGQNFLRLQLFNKSIDAFGQALKYKPGDPTATVGLADARYGMHMANGAAFMAGKKYGSAVDEFEAALKAKPNDTSATNALSQARFRLLNEKMAK
jgi:tetratricopeptide (TPR) repeat protein